MQVDIELLAALEAKATAGPWATLDWPRSITIEAKDDLASCDTIATVAGSPKLPAPRADAALIVALRNNATALFAELRELRAKLATSLEVRAELHERIGQDEAALRETVAERDALRAELKGLKDDKSWNDGVIYELRAQLATAHDEAESLQARLNEALVAHSFCDENKADLRAHRNKLEKERDEWMARAMSMG